MRVVQLIATLTLPTLVTVAVHHYINRRHGPSEVSVSTSGAYSPDPSDARLQPGAYIHNASATSPKVCLVLEATDAQVLVECAKTSDVFTITPWLLCTQWKLAQAAPTVPDYASEAVTV